MPGSEPEPPSADDKDWTWTAQRRCPDCGYDPMAVTGPQLGRALRETTPRWAEVLDRGDVRDRPKPEVWSPLEYGCHLRDVHRVFTERVALMLTEHDPQFANWDQDRAALDGRYWEQPPRGVAPELVVATESAAAGYDAVPANAWGRRGRRSNGAVFTVESIGRYHLHDVLHHLYDVRG